MTFTDKELDGLLQRLENTPCTDCKEAAAAITYLRQRDPIGAAIMRERAVDALSDVVTGASILSSKAIEDAEEILNRLPPPRPAELLAYALELPEIKALIAASAMAWQGLVGEYGNYSARVNFGELEDALDALASLEPKPLCLAR